MLILKKIKGGILPTVITISVLITLIVSSIILLAYYKNILLAHNDIQGKLILNAHSGINYILGENKSFKGELILDLYDDEKDSVYLKRKNWGVFDVGLSVAFTGRHRKQLAILIGNSLDRYGRSALYLADENRPLSISGNTILRGNCYLPKAGIKTAYINQQSYLRTELIEGKVFESKLELPKPDMEYLKRIENGGYSKKTANQHILKNETNSFFNETLQLSSLANISLDNTFLHGNIEVSTPKTVTISNSANLKDIIVNGAKVIVKEGFKGSLQVFASDTIIVEQNVELDYPSALITYGESNKSRIVIQENSKVKGIIFIPGTDADYYGNILQIAKSCEITGQVYVDGLVEQQGIINGNLTCKRFLLNTPSTLYENHLLDAVIDYKSLSKHFLTSPLLSKSNKTGIVKWLD